MHFLIQNFVIDSIEGLSQIAKYGNFFFLLPWKQNSSYGLLDAFAEWAFLKPCWSGVRRCRHSEIQHLLKRYVFCTPDCSTAVQKCLKNYNNINIYYTIYKIKIYQNLKFCIFARLTTTNDFNDIREFLLSNRQHKVCYVLWQYSKKLKISCQQKITK